MTVHSSMATVVLLSDYDNWYFVNIKDLWIDGCTANFESHAKKITWPCLVNLQFIHYLVTWDKFQGPNLTTGKMSDYSSERPLAWQQIASSQFNCKFKWLSTITTSGCNLDASLWRQIQNSIPHRGSIEKKIRYYLLQKHDGKEVVAKQIFLYIALIWTLDTWKRKTLSLSCFHSLFLLSMTFLRQLHWFGDTTSNLQTQLPIFATHFVKFYHT